MSKRLTEIDKTIDANMVVMCRCFDASQRIVTFQISSTFLEEGKEVVEIDGLYAITLEIFRSVTEHIGLHEMGPDDHQEMIDEWVSEQKVVAQNHQEERAAAIAEVEKQNAELKKVQDEAVERVEKANAPAVSE